MNAFAGIVLVVFCVLPIILAKFILTFEDSVTSKVMAVLCVFASILCVAYMVRYSDRLFSWGVFEEDRVVVKNPFKRIFYIEYDKLVDVGFGYYVHGILNTQVGSKVNYIYLSCVYLTEKDKINTNLLPITNKFVKVGYSEKLYNYLIDVLPEKQSRKLKRSKEEFGNSIR